MGKFTNACEKENKTIDRNDTIKINLFIKIGNQDLVQIFQLVSPVMFIIG